MKLFNSLLIFALISIASNAQMCDGDITASSYEECKNYELPPGQDHCCYSHIAVERDGVTQEQKKCGPITEQIYEHIDIVIEEIKKKYESHGYKVIEFILDCGQPK